MPSNDSYPVIEYFAPWSKGMGCFSAFRLTTGPGAEPRDISIGKAKKLIAAGTHHFRNVRRDRHGKEHVTAYGPTQFEDALDWIRTNARR
jgi:hypothetical protein